MLGSATRSKSKLVRLREWLTVQETARHLATLAEEDVTEADVLRLALEGHITLSVNLVNHGKARCGGVVPLADAKRFEIPIRPGDFPDLEMEDGDQGWFVGVNGLSLGDGRVFEPAKEVVTIEGIWDLTMLGAERLDVEHRFQRLTGGPAVDLVCLDGPLLCLPDGTHCQLQEHFENNEFYKAENLKRPWTHPDNFYPAGKLPHDAAWVVRTSELERLAGTLNGRALVPDKPLERRERTTLLVVIAALAKIAKLDIAKPSSAAAAIETQTALMGARVAARTIEEHLKRVGEALDARS
jgi:hypothetical protein